MFLRNPREPRTLLADLLPWAAIVAPTMLLLTRSVWPLVSLLQVSSRGVLHMLGSEPEARSRVTREEVKSLIAEAERAGVVPPPLVELPAKPISLSVMPVSSGSRGGTTNSTTKSAPAVINGRASCRSRKLVNSTKAGRARTSPPYAVREAEKKMANSVTALPARVTRVENK